MHGLFTGQHTVNIALDGVDLPVVEDEPVGMGTLPAGEGIGGKTGVYQRQGGAAAFILQIGIKTAQLLHKEHALVYDGTAGKGGNVGIGDGLLKLPAHDVQPPVKVQSGGHALRPPDKALGDIGHTGQGLLPQYFRPRGHIAPEQQLHALLAQQDLKQLHAAASPDPVLGQEKHAHAVIPWPAQVDATLLPHGGEKLVGHLEQYAHAVAGLSGSVPARTVAQLLHDGERVADGLMAGLALQVHHSADAAGVVLKSGVVQGLFLSVFHGLTSVKGSRLPIFTKYNFLCETCQ